MNGNHFSVADLKREFDKGKRVGAVEIGEYAWKMFLKNESKKKRVKWLKKAFPLSGSSVGYVKEQPYGNISFMVFGKGEIKRRLLFLKKEAEGKQ